MIIKTLRDIVFETLLPIQTNILNIFERSISYLLTRSLIAPYLKSLLGKDLHQKILRFSTLHYWPQIRNPRTFNEKIMFRKLYTNKAIFSTVEDKWAVRDYVRDRIGEEYLPEIYFSTSNPESIPFNSLPESYVIKPSHLSGEIILVDASERLKHDEVISRCDCWLTMTHGILAGEYWNSMIKPRVLIEERLYDEEYGVPLDYKLFVFHGRVEFIQVDLDRFSNHTRRFYTRDWVPQDFTLEYPLGPVIERPKKLKEMIKVAESLGDQFEHVRVDLYQPNGEAVIFGEMTVAHGSGAEPFNPRDYDSVFGDLW